MIKKNFTYTLFSLFLSIGLNGQVGINTSTPSATLDIVSGGNTNSTKALEINNSASNELITVLDNGNIGVNTTTPSGKLHLIGDTSTNDVLYLENLQGVRPSASSSIMRIGSNGKVLRTLSGPETILTYFRSSSPQALDQTSNVGQLVTFTESDSLINFGTSFDAATSTFTVLEEGLYTITGFVGFNGFRTDFTQLTQFIAINLYFEYSSDNGANWSQLTGVRNTFVGLTAGIGTTISIPAVAANLAANSRVRLIIQRPNLTINGNFPNQNLGTPPAGNGHINLPGGQAFTKSVLISKL